MEGGNCRGRKRDRGNYLQDSKEGGGVILNLKLSFD